MTAFNLRVGSATHVGQLRKINQDAIVTEGGIFGVADGMGGHQGGEVASAVAVEVLGQGMPTATPAGFETAVNAANRAVYEQGQARDDLAGMGTTLVAIAEVIVDDEPNLVIVNVGDSRGYLLRDRDLVQITEDHSLVADLVRAGRITAEEAEHHPRRNIVTRVLGLDDTVRVDQFAVLPFEGDRFLMCSDGLTNEVSAADITATLRRIDDPTEAAEELVRMANEAGGRDNISIVIVDVLDDAGQSVPGSAVPVDQAADPGPTDVVAPDDAPTSSDDDAEVEAPEDELNELDALGALGTAAAVGAAGALGAVATTDVNDPVDAAASSDESASVLPPDEAEDPVDPVPETPDEPSEPAEADEDDDLSAVAADGERVGGVDVDDGEPETAPEQSDADETADTTTGDTTGDTEGETAETTAETTTEGETADATTGDTEGETADGGASAPVAADGDPADAEHDPEPAADDTTSEPTDSHPTDEPTDDGLDDEPTDETDEPDTSSADTPAEGEDAPEDDDAPDAEDDDEPPRGRRARRRAAAAAAAASAGGATVAAAGSGAATGPAAGEKVRIQAERVGEDRTDPAASSPDGSSDHPRTTADLAGFGRALDDEQLADSDADIVVEEEDLDDLIPKRRGFSWRVAAFLFIFCAVIGIAIGALGVYARGTYYVGFDDNRVAIFQGRPGGVLFFDPTVEAHSNVVRTELLPVSAGQVDDQPDFATFAEADLYIGNLQLVTPDKTPVVSQPGSFDSDPSPTTSTTEVEDPLPPDAPTPAGSPTTSTP